MNPKTCISYRWSLSMAWFIGKKEDPTSIYNMKFLHSWDILRTKFKIVTFVSQLLKSKIYIPRWKDQEADYRMTESSALTMNLQILVTSWCSMRNLEITMWTDCALKYQAHPYKAFSHAPTRSYIQSPLTDHCLIKWFMKPLANSIFSQECHSCQTLESKGENVDNNK